MDCDGFFRVYGKRDYIIHKACFHESTSVPLQGLCAVHARAEAPPHIDLLHARRIPDRGKIIFRRRAGAVRFIKRRSDFLAKLALIIQMGLKFRNGDGCKRRICCSNIGL